MRPRTVRQRYDFGGLVDRLDGPDAWDTLRLEGPAPFRFPDAYADEAERHDQFKRRAEALLAHLTEPVASYGVGVGLLEWWLAQRGVDLTVTDYAPATVTQLENVGFRAVRHDLLNDAPLPAETHLMHRVDTEFTDRQWRRILKRYERVVFVPGGLWADAQIKEERQRRGDRAGWLRNEAAVKRLWRRSHRADPIVAHDLPGWVLTRSNPAALPLPPAS